MNQCYPNKFNLQRIMLTLMLSIDMLEAKVDTGKPNGTGLQKSRQERVAAEHQDWETDEGRRQIMDILFLVQKEVGKQFS